MQQPLFLFYVERIKKYIPEEFHSFVAVEPPKDPKFGDFSSNIAMVLAKKIQQAPMEFAEKLREQFEHDECFEQVNVKRPAFINWNVPKEILKKYFPHMLAKNFGKTNLGRGAPINVEYVSANPTGPLHAGHVRGAVSGDVLARLLQFTGFSVTKEFYINDAGKQIEKLARSLYYRYAELYGRVGDEPEKLEYGGEYLVDVAKKIKRAHGRDFLDKDESKWCGFFKEFAINDIMKGIKKDLKDLGVHHDVFFSEKELIKNRNVDQVLQILDLKGLLYRGVLDCPKGEDNEDWEPREQLLFKSTQFGDDVDRPLQKSDGSWTYFATDIAYHKNKMERGFEEMVDFWGADHGGYVKRMQAAVAALSDSTKTLKVKLVQLVKLTEDGKEVKMSKRAGTFVTARDILDKVGKDIIRFIMLMRRDDAPLDFDFKKVVDQSKDNPVFYVQYAYARINSVLKQFSATFSDRDCEINAQQVNLDLLDAPGYWGLLKILADWPRQVIMAANHREPHRLAFYLYDVASTFHSLWNSGKEDAQLRFVLVNDFEKTCARIALLSAVRNILGIGFGIIGVTPVEELR